MTSSPLQTLNDNGLKTKGVAVPCISPNGHQNAKDLNDRIKKLEEENRMLRTMETASKMRIRTSKMRIRATLAETVKTMNEEKDAAAGKNDIQVQRLKSEIAMRLQAQQETASWRDRYSSKKSTTRKSMEYITIEDN